MFILVWRCACANLKCNVRPLQRYSASEEIRNAGTVPPSTDESREKAVSGLQAAFGLVDNGETLRALKRPSETCKSTETCGLFRVFGVILKPQLSSAGFGCKL